MKRSFFGLCVGVHLLACLLSTGTSAPISVNHDVSSMSLTFTENMGQWPDSVLFRGEAENVTMWFTPTGVYHQLVRHSAEGTSGDLEDVSPDRPDDVAKRTETMMIKAELVGSNQMPQTYGTDKLDYLCNFYLGSDPGRWRTDVPNYRSIVLEDVYGGIDLIYYGKDSRMEYDFLVAPGADYSQIEILYKGAERVAIAEDGSIAVATLWGEIKEQAPVVYQEIDGTRKPIVARYILKSEGAFGFHLGPEYDPELVVTIDPVLVLEYSTSLGGSSYDCGRDIDIASNGMRFVTGETESADFPLEDPYQTYQGTATLSDAFVTAFTADGSGLHFSTYLGGTDEDWGNGVGYDGIDAVYVAGRTMSTDFPTKLGLMGHQGNADGFVTKLDYSGYLQYSTYLGGSYSDYCTGLDVGPLGAVVVAGGTESNDFPTHGPYQTNQGGRDAFVTVFAPLMSTPVYWYSTYLGGSSHDFAEDVVWNDQMEAYVVGYTSSSDFPTKNSYQAYQGDNDVFVTKLSSSGASLFYSSLVGGTDRDEALGVDINSAGEACIVGVTWSTDYTTVNPFQATSGGGTLDAFVTKMNAAGDSPVFSTYLGGDDLEYAYDVSFGPGGAVHVIGLTGSTDFPTVSSWKEADPHHWDIFISMFDAVGSIGDYSTYFGGDYSDYGYAIDVIDQDIHVTGHENGYAVVATLRWCDDLDEDQVCDDRDNCLGLYNHDQVDTDSDGLGNLCDTDDDNDGVPDESDTDPLDPYVCMDYDSDGCDDCAVGVDGFGPYGDADPWNDGPDPDWDMICDLTDNCPNTFNPDQTDLNENGIGDACEACCGFYTGGITGNANCSVDGKLTLSDISRMIDRVYISKDLLCCEAAGNTNATTDCKITLSDITVLIDAVYISKADPEPCMPECEQ